MNEKDDKLNKGSFLYINDKEKAEWGQPEGYPYKGMGAILDGTFEFADDSGTYMHQIADENFSYANGKSYSVIWDGEVYQCVATIFRGLLVLGNLGILVTGNDTGEPFLFIDQGNGQKMIGTNSTAAIHTITVRTEVAYPITSEFLPEGYPYTEAAEIVCAETIVENGASITNPLSTMLTAGYKYKVIHNDISYECIAYESTFDGRPCISIGNMSLHNPSLSGGNGEPFVFACLPLFDLSVGGFSEIGNHTFSIERSETFHPIASEFLPLATPTTAGAMKQAAAVANVTAAPTAEEFNALLKSLRDAGILTTS